MSDDTPPLAVSARLRFEILRRDGYRCRYCGATAAENELHVDHVLPRTLGGTTEPSNLVAACRGCNLGKSSTLLSSETIKDVTETNQVRGEAIAAAIAQIIDEASDLRPAERFREAWQRWKRSDDHTNAPLPPVHELAASLRSWARYGLALDDAIRLIPVAFQRKNVRPEDMFRYFCGVCWRTIERAGELAEVQ